MTGMTCTRCRTEDPSRSSTAPPRQRLLVRISLSFSPTSLCLSVSLLPSPVLSSAVSISARRLRRARSGYLLRGRCGLNLINSMRHLDKCAPRTRIQRIIFILIHFPSPLLPAGPRSPPAAPPPPPCCLSVDPSLRSPRLRFVRLASPRLAKPRRSGRSNRFFGYQIPDSYSSSASTLRGGRAGEWEVGRKKDAFIRSHLAGIICLFDVAPYLIR